MVLAVFGLAADECFVRFNDLVRAAQRAGLSFAQRLADAMAEEPRGFLAEPEHAANLKGGHALLGRHHEMRCGEPLVERYLAALVQRAHGHSERFAAGVALIQAWAV